MQEIKQRKNLVQKKIGKIVQKYRLKQDKSISLICAEIGISKSIWADLEKGIKDPQLSTLLRIAEALNVNLSDLIQRLEKTLGKDFSMIE